MNNMTGFSLLAPQNQEKFIKITYHSDEKNKVSIYLRLVDAKDEATTHRMIVDRISPEGAIRKYWIDKDGDEIDVSNQYDYDAFLAQSLHLHVAPRKPLRQASADQADKPTDNGYGPQVDDPVAFVIHERVECDACGQRPLIGFRYKCIQCPNFDLCQRCESQHKHSEHMMVRMPSENSPTIESWWLEGPPMFGGRSGRHSRRERRGEFCPFAAAAATQTANSNEQTGNEDNNETRGSFGYAGGSRHQNRRLRRRGVLSQVYQVMQDLAEGGAGVYRETPEDDVAQNSATNVNKQATADPAAKVAAEKAAHAAESAAKVAAEKAARAAEHAQRIAREAAENIAQQSAQNIKIQPPQDFLSYIMSHQAANNMAQQAATNMTQHAVNMAQQAAQLHIKNLGAQQFAKNETVNAEASAPTQDAPKSQQGATVTPPKQEQTEKATNADTTTPQQEQPKENNSDENTSVPVTPSLDDLAQLIDPKLMKAGMQLLSNFGEMFARIMEPVDSSFTENPNDDSANESNNNSSYSKPSNDDEKKEQNKKSENEQKNDEHAQQTTLETEKKDNKNIGTNPETEVSINISRDSSEEGDWQVIDKQQEEPQIDSVEEVIPIETDINHPETPAAANKEPAINYVLLSNDLKNFIDNENKREEQDKSISSMNGMSASTSTGLSTSTSISVSINGRNAASGTPANVNASAAGGANSMTPIVYHQNDRINKAVHAMMAMGFSNEGAWLTQLLESVNGNIGEALDLMSPAQQTRRN